MPKAVKQQPSGRPPPAPDGSILSRVVPVGELKDSWIKLLVYGPNGVGKTTLACTFPKPLLLVSYEPATTGGARSVRKVPGVQFVKLSSTQEGVQLCEELRQNNPYKTHVIDSVTSMQAMELERILGRPVPEQIGFGTVNGDQYRERAERMKHLLALWGDLACHTVFVGKEKDHNPPREEKTNPKTGKLQPDMRPRFIRGIQQESFVSVDLGGGTAGWLQDSCDYVGRLYFDREMRAEKTTYNGQEIVDVVETGRFIRALRIAYHPNFMARFRSDTPENLPDAIENPTFDKILAAIEGRKPRS